MKILLCVLSLFVMLSCSRTADSEFVASLTDEPTSVAVSQKPNAAQPVSERKLVRTGTMSFEVEKVTTARAMVMTVLSDLGGYIASENQSNDEHPNYEQVVRVPTNHVDDFVVRIDAIASKLGEKHFTSQDVTEEYVDYESRVAAKRRMEARYQEIVKQAKSIEEILEVESQIGNVNAEIETIEGKLKYLTNKTSFSTITLKYYEPNVEVVPGIGGKFAESFLIGWNAAMILLVALTRTWPFLLIAGAVSWLIMRRKRKEPNQAIQTQ